MAFLALQVTTYRFWPLQAAILRELKAVFFPTESEKDRSILSRFNLVLVDLLFAKTAHD